MTKSLSVIAFFILLMVVPVLATFYIVGDYPSGWDPNVDYTAWVKDKNFVVGDVLEFIDPQIFWYYGLEPWMTPNNVYEVNFNDYSSCTAVGDPVRMDKDSSGVIRVPLTTAGTRYFICGKIGHCGAGMKLAVTTRADVKETFPMTSGTSPSSSIILWTPSGSLQSSGAPSESFNSPQSSSTIFPTPPTSTVYSSSSPRVSAFVFAFCSTWIVLVYKLIAL